MRCRGSRLPCGLHADSLAGRPHAGKVLAAIQPHSDDIPLFAGGTVAKLIREGYSGCLIRMTNDEKAGRADFVYVNEGSLGELDAFVAGVVKEFRAAPGPGPH